MRADELVQEPHSMISLDDLSQIGFGCHLVSDTSQEHYSAMTHALHSGCNLFDTSANYMGGNSERLIGRVLADNRTYGAFVITKSGYDERERLGLVENGVARDNLLHPEFLENRISLSLSRLQRTYIDGYLLHSPESFLEQQVSESRGDEFYSHLRKAFELLESKVTAGVIRYYGISSNTFHRPLHEATTIDLRRVIDIASTVCSNNHFKLIEFPFNLTETSAASNHHGGTSLLSLAKAHRLVTLSNRPLNAKTVDGVLRLAVYDGDLTIPLREADTQVFADFLSIMTEQLVRFGASEDVMEFAVVQYLNKNWQSIGNPEAVDQIFREYLYPFLDRLYGGVIPDRDLKVYRKMYDATVIHSKRERAQRTIEFCNALVSQGVIDQCDKRPLPVIACGFYLDSGVDHVLVGMREKKYVEEMKALFFEASVE